MCHTVCITMALQCNLHLARILCAEGCFGHLEGICAPVEILSSFFCLSPKYH